MCNSFDNNDHQIPFLTLMRYFCKIKDYTFIVKVMECNFPIYTLNYIYCEKGKKETWKKSNSFLLFSPRRKLQASFNLFLNHLHFKNVEKFPNVRM